MCCCKWCQYYLESIYWHCFEKHFCFDMSIALYEDEDTIKESDGKGVDIQATSQRVKMPSVVNNNIYDNMAFYDNVAMIAKRSIFIIDPLDVRKPSMTTLYNVLPSSSDPETGDAITEQPKATRVTFPDDLARSEPNLDLHATAAKPVPLIRTNTTSLTSLATICEEHPPTPRLQSGSSGGAPVQVKLRKKSLHERRVSKSLTLDIDCKRQEVPITRQSSYPKFYMDTPDVNQTASTIGSSSIQALETPVVPNIFQFDLQTIVQLQNEKQLEIAEQERLRQELLQPQHHHVAGSLRRAVTSAKETTRIQQIRDKLKPIKLLRNASAQSLYSQKDLH